MAVVSVRIDGDLLAAVDDFAAKVADGNRSVAIRMCVEHAMGNRLEAAAQREALRVAYGRLAHAFNIEAREALERMASRLELEED